jgi:hypothetical protein
LNYISHYRFFHRKNDPYFNCGLIFPDWVAAYKRNRFTADIIASGIEEEKLKEGIGLHYYGDKKFHGSEFFEEARHGIKLILEQSGLDKEKFRFSFLSHLLLEMMIDRILIKDNPALGLEFYDSLDLCNLDLLVRFAINNSGVDEGCRELISGFRQHRFILHYTNDEGLAYSLSRITRRVGISFSDAELKMMMLKFPEIESYIISKWKGLEELFNA